MTYSWKDDPNGLIVRQEEHTVKIVAQDGPCHLLPHEARNLASALLIAAEAIEDKKEERP